MWNSNFILELFTFSTHTGDLHSHTYRVKHISYARAKYDKNTGKLKSVSGVNITLGLNFIRTSVDHGTAYGKAGRMNGTASPQSLKEAILYAVQMTKARKNQ
jgi:hypothetical protein